MTPALCSPGHRVFLQDRSLKRGCLPGWVPGGQQPAIPLVRPQAGTCQHCPLAGGRGHLRKPVQLAGSRPVGTVGTQLPAFQWVPVFREWRQGDSGPLIPPRPPQDAPAGRWGTGRSSPAPPGLATRFGLGTGIKASGICEPDWAQQGGEAWASAPTQEPALSWDRHGQGRAWGCELAAGGVAGGRGHGAGTCQSGPQRRACPAAPLPAPCRSL